MKDKITQFYTKRNQLDAETEALIIDVLQHNGGRVTFVPEEDDEYDSMDSITMHTDNGNPNINVTDVYLRAQEHADKPDIKVDGIDTSDGSKQTNIDVYSEHYSHILSFINVTLYSK